MTLDRGNQQRRHKLRHRRATTLIEVMGTLSVLLVIGLSAVSILTKITDIGSRANAFNQNRASIERLSVIFRNDVQGSQQLNLSDDDSSIEMVAGEQKIQYSWLDPSLVLRRVTKADQQVGIDRFPLPARCRPSCSLENDVVSWRLSDQGQSRPWILEVKKP